MYQIGHATINAVGTLPSTCPPGPLGILCRHAVAGLLKGPPQHGFLSQTMPRFHSFLCVPFLAFPHEKPTHLSPGHFLEAVAYNLIQDFSSRSPAMVLLLPLTFAL